MTIPISDSRVKYLQRLQASVAQSQQEVSSIQLSLALAQQKAAMAADHLRGAIESELTDSSSKEPMPPGDFTWQLSQNTVTGACALTITGVEGDHKLESANGNGLLPMPHLILPQ